MYTHLCSLAAACKVTTQCDIYRTIYMCSHTTAIRSCHHISSRRAITTRSCHHASVQYTALKISLVSQLCICVRSHSVGCWSLHTCNTCMRLTSFLPLAGIDVRKSVSLSLYLSFLCGSHVWDDRTVRHSLHGRLIHCRIHILTNSEMALPCLTSLHGGS